MIFNKKILLILENIPFHFMSFEYDEVVFKIGYCERAALYSVSAACL